MNLYQSILNNKKQSKKMLAVLIDPDRVNANDCARVRDKSKAAGVDYFFVGSSILTGDNFKSCISILKESAIPVILFPGDTMQISRDADALLFLSLISGRNAEMLIGRHVVAAPYLKRSGLEIVSTGYMLIDSGAPTAAGYMSNTTPIPHTKHDIAVATAIAAELLGFKLIYLDAGSGARYPVNSRMIEEVGKNISIPLIVGGGITTPEKAVENCQAGADIIVIGNAIEKDEELIFDMASAIHSCQTI
jgi:putative glycerol-1-phosphate prenyltransferase